MDFVFSVLDRFLTPDVTDPGLNHLYGVTLWLSLVVALVIGFGQVGLAAVRRDGQSLGSLAMGIVQYGAVVACWVAVCGGLIVGCAGLTRGLLARAARRRRLLRLLRLRRDCPTRSSAPSRRPCSGCARCSSLIPAAFGYLLIMLVREAALLILTATMPIAAAGALGEGTRAWMWKSIRWFVAACLTAPLLALVVGIGVQISRAAFPDGEHRRRAAARPGSGGAHQIADNAASVGHGGRRLRDLLDRLLLPDGAVPAARLRRPRHRLGSVVPVHPGRQRRRRRA